MSSLIFEELQEAHSAGCKLFRGKFHYARKLREKKRFQPITIGASVKGKVEYCKSASCGATQSLGPAHEVHRRYVLILHLHSHN